MEVCEREARERRTLEDVMIGSDPPFLVLTAYVAMAAVMAGLWILQLRMRNASFTRLEDAQEGGVSYQRLLTTLRPGFGFSEADDVVVWIHPETNRLFRVHLTLNGFETTQGAHVDTTFLEYRQIGQMLVPVELNERVRGPIRINAHRWHLTGADLNRGWNPSEVRGPELQGSAAEPAQKF